MSIARQFSTKKRRFTLATLIVLAFILAAGMAAYAKYVHQAADDRVATTNSFYFASDFLSEQGSSYTLCAGTTQISIELRNYADSLRWSDDDVEYSYEVVRRADDGSETQFGSGTGTITRSSGSPSTSTVTISGLSTGTYVVTASSTSPYASSLTGTFIIPEEGDAVGFKVNDSPGSPYATLVVSTEGYSGDVVVSWPEGVFPDTSQKTFADVDTYDEASGAYAAGSKNVGVLGKFGSATYRFLKVDPSQDYSTSADGASAPIKATANND